jgi:hypothetical protein
MLRVFDVTDIGQQADSRQQTAERRKRKADTRREAADSVIFSCS